MSEFQIGKAAPGVPVIRSLGSPEIDVDKYTAGFTDEFCRYMLAAIRQRLDESDQGIVGYPGAIRVVPLAHTFHFPPPGAPSNNVLLINGLTTVDKPT